jgi:hypothetical protein
VKKIYYRYELWEDYKNGMYDDGDIHDEELINKAKCLLKNNSEFLSASLEMIDKWIYSSKMNLSNKNRNRQAWIGQACCCYLFGVPENLTKIAWHALTESEKSLANAIADKVINYYEYRVKNKCQKKQSELMF